MTDERYIAIWDARAALCRAHGDEISADYWTDQAERLSDRIEAARTKRRPILRGVDLLRISESSDEAMITGGPDRDMPVVDVGSIARQHCAPVSFYAKPANA